MTTGPFGSTQKIRSSSGIHHRVELVAIEVRVIEGLDRGARVILAQSSITIGGSRDCDLVLSDPSVSRRHSRVGLDDEGLVLADLGSTNGTWIGEVRIDAARIPRGTRFRVGQSVLEAGSVTDELLACEDLPMPDRLLIGKSDVMRELWNLIRLVAPTPASVLLRGESGTGKEVVARLLHERSGRSGPLVVFEGSAISKELIGSELFGHARGAFTGADRARIGSFRQAHRGTLFLDEIAELPLELQSVLLRALESREVRPIGSDEVHPVDVRVIAATHQDLDSAVRDGRFRLDLLHRLRIIQLDLPPLRDRIEDIPLLVEHFRSTLGVTASFGEAALTRLRQHTWPGNVRELRNIVERAGILSAGGPVGPRELQLDGHPASRIAGGNMAAESLRLDEIERRAIFEALRRTGGHQAQAAKLLGLGLSTLKVKLKQYRESGE